MSLIKFCDYCSGILGPINLENGIMLCTKCNGSHKLPENDKTIMYYRGETKENTRKISIIEAQRLAKMPTTATIIKKCNKCGFDYAAQLYDDEFKFTLCCLKCEDIIST